MMTYEEAQLVTENRDLGWPPSTVEEADAVKEAHLRAVAWASPPVDGDNAGDNEDDGFWISLFACIALVIGLGGFILGAIHLIGSIW